MQIQFEQHIKTRFPDLKGKKILLTISGGIDSVVLAHLSKRAKLTISFAHCNFHLRGEESDGDQLFVEKLAEELGVPLFVQHFDTKKYGLENKLSTQLSARKLRYDWFEELRHEHEFDCIFTAHHVNDSLETFLINTIRGTGLEGLTGIPEQNGSIIRPLLPFSRKEILAYAKSEDIAWREDSTNASVKYERNKIRHQVIPIFEDENPHLLSSFVKTQQHLQDASDLLEEYNVLLFEEIVTDVAGDLYFNIQKIREKSNPKAVLYQLLKNYGFTAWEDIYRLLSSQSGKVVFSPSHRLLKNREELILTKIPDENNDPQEIEITETDAEIVFPLGKLIFTTAHSFEKSNVNQIYVDKSLVNFPLKLRRWKESDYFRPFGMKGKKKISSYLKDEKFSLVEKEKVWLLISEGKVVWIIGHRADERFKVKPSISNIMKIELIN